MEAVKEKIDPKPTGNVVDIKAQTEIMHRTLAAYMEVCTVLNQPHKALNALTFHRFKVKKCNNNVFPPIKDVKVYNALLRGYSTKADFIKLQEVIKYAKEDNIQLNVQSYISIFDCLARVNYKNNHLKHIRIYVKDAYKNGISFDKILNEGIFINEQKSRVLETMLCYDPNYQPKYTDPNLQYSNDLLNHLNHPEQLEMPKTIENASLNLFTTEKLRASIEEQIELEKKGLITVLKK